MPKNEMTSREKAMKGAKETEKEPVKKAPVDRTKIYKASLPGKAK